MAKEEKKDQPEVQAPTPVADVTGKDVVKGKTPKEKNHPKEEVKVPDLNDRKEYKIVIIKDGKHLKEGQTKTVSGNVAKQLIKIGIAKLI